MTARRDPDRLIRTYLDDGPTELADRSYDAVRDRIDHIRQRTVFGPWREFQVSKYAPIVLVAAAVLVVAVLAINFLPRQGGVGGASSSATPPVSLTPAPSPTAAATAVPTVAPSPAALSIGDIEAGTYVTRPFRPPNESISFTFTAPDGWEAGGPAGRAPTGIFPQEAGHEAPGGMALGFLTISSLESDPCQWNGASAIQIGPSVSDLVEALRENGGYRVSTPVDGSLGGYSGVLLDLEVPADVDLSACDEGEFWVWADGDGGTIYAQGPEMRYHLWILDVQGDRVIVMTHDFPGTSAEDRTELQAIVDSIRIAR